MEVKVPLWNDKSFWRRKWKSAMKSCDCCLETTFTWILYSSDLFILSPFSFYINTTCHRVTGKNPVKVGKRSLPGGQGDVSREWERDARIKKATNGLEEPKIGGAWDERTFLECHRSLYLWFIHYTQKYLTWWLWHNIIHLIYRLGQSWEISSKIRSEVDFRVDFSTIFGCLLSDNLSYLKFNHFVSLFDTFLAVK